MKELFVNAVTKGDLSPLNEKLLHSAYWEQHNAKHYGQNALNPIKKLWLGVTQSSQLIDEVSMQCGNYMVLLLKLDVNEGGSIVNYVFFIEQNGKVIKSVRAIVDTMQLSSAYNKSKIQGMLPQPDPLVIAEYDQQDHLQSDIAVPSSLISKSFKFAGLLDEWWSIWAKQQFADITKVYDADAKISISGISENLCPTQLFSVIVKKLNKLSRPFAQIEDVIIDDNKVAINWFLDGSLASKKVRLPIFTLLELKNSTIFSEYTIYDVLSFEKRFDLTDIL